MRKSLALGVLVVLLCGAALGALIIWSGAIDVAATKTGGLPDRVLAYAAVRSIRHHAKDEGSAPVNDPEALKEGLRNYRSMCVACHGGPGAEPAAFAAGLYPPAPDLGSPAIQSFADPMLYETIAGGIGSTGMPAFGRRLQPKEIWSVVAFLRHLAALSPAEKQQLGGGLEASPEGRNVPRAGPAEAGATVHRVSINNLKFDPPALEVHAGDVVEWANSDFVAHTATADDGTFDTGKIEGGGTKRITVGKSGTFPYSCSYHPTMKGTLTVQ